MSNPANSTLPRLLIDRQGTVGLALLPKLTGDNLTIFVSKDSPPPGNQLMHIPFLKRIPRIPDNTFSEIIMVYQGEKELQEALPAIIKKAEQSSATFYFVTTIFYFNAKAIAKLREILPRCVVIVCGDIFSDNLSPTTPLQQLLLEAKLSGRMTLSHSGLQAFYPVALADVVEGVAALLTATSLPAQLIALYPKHPPTGITIARLMQKIYPTLHVDFTKKSQASSKIALPEDAIYLFGSGYPLEERLKKLDFTATPLLGKSKAKKKNAAFLRSNRSKKPLYLFVSILFFLFALPSLISMGFAASGGLMLLQSQKSLESGDFSKAESQANTAQILFSVAIQSVSTLKNTVGQVLGSHELLGVERTLEKGEKVAVILRGSSQAATSLKLVLSGRSVNPKEDFLDGIGRLKESLRMLQGMQVEGEIPENYAAKYAEVEPLVATVLNTIDTYPNLLGFDERKKYIVLFQNNYELRSTGGFIGSYGLLTVEQGRVASFSIQDVYETDGQLTEHIEPPFALRRYLGVTNWNMRDSNYALDFPEAAADVALFFKRTTGTEVDGVLAVDTVFLSNLLAITGPVNLPDYNETITKENFFLTTQKHVEEKFFPGSTQKRDYLTALKIAVETKLANTAVPYSKVAQVLISSSKEKHLLVAFADEGIQRLYTVNNLSSSLWEGRLSKQGKILDFLGVNETNIGLNKGNYYLERKIGHEVTIDGEGTVAEAVQLTYTNTSTTTSLYGGEYKAYLRFLLPENAIVTGLLIDQAEQETTPAITDPTKYTLRGFSPPKELEVEQGAEKGKKIVGLLLNVPALTTKSISLRYQLAENFSVEAAESEYSLRLFKQPGTLSDPYALTVRYPLGVTLLESSKGVQNLGGKLSFETPLDSDKELQLLFSKNN